jgi:hypothetical protein
MSVNGHRCTGWSALCPETSVSPGARYRDPVRWEWLFADLEAQIEADDRASFEAEVGDLVRAERGAIPLRDRLRAHVGCDLALHVRGGGVVDGALLDVGADWVLVRGAAADLLLPVSSVVAVSGLSRSAISDDARPARALKLSVVLRGLAADRAPVSVELSGGLTVTGTIDRVGADHLDLAVHALDEPRRQGNVAGVRTLRTSAIEQLTVP